MLAFLLALVLEDATEPVGGWRWVIAAQKLRCEQATLGTACDFEQRV